ncbi:MAG: FHA domain-containing protein [Acidobacteriota bacterium]|nr:FHA domain-containing protein [Acidobacteriota bacterium]
MGLLDTLRRWVDGEDAEDALSRAAAEQARPRRQAEQFIVTIARAIGEVMQAEAVPLPPDQIVIPPEYLVFLSEEDDREWQGMKRRALEQGLYHVLAEHARDLAGKTKLATASFSVELRVDGTLEKGEVRVQHSWEESASTTKTNITPRKGAQQPAVSSPPQQNAQNQPQNVQNQGSQLAPTMFAPGGMQPKVVERNTPNNFAPKTDSSSGGLDNEATQVKKRELYRLEIWRGNQQLSVTPVFQQQITIGRKSQKIASDIQLDGDPEISRPHAILTRDSTGKFWITHKGKNPTLVSGREVPAGQPMPVTPQDSISICSYVLRIQP